MYLLPPKTLTRTVQGACFLQWGGGGLQDLTIYTITGKSDKKVAAAAPNSKCLKNDMGRSGSCLIPNDLCNFWWRSYSCSAILMKKFKAWPFSILISSKCEHHPSWYNDGKLYFWHFPKCHFGDNSFTATSIRKLYATFCLIMSEMAKGKIITCSFCYHLQFLFRYKVIWFKYWNWSIFWQFQWGWYWYYDGLVLWMDYYDE